MAVYRFNRYLSGPTVLGYGQIPYRSTNYGFYKPSLVFGSSCVVVDRAHTFNNICQCLTTLLESGFSLLCSTTPTPNLSSIRLDIGFQLEAEVCDLFDDASRPQQQAFAEVVAHELDANREAIGEAAGHANRRYPCQARWHGADVL